MKTSQVLIPEYAKTVMHLVPKCCQTCQYCYIGTFEPDSPWAVPEGIAYMNGDLGIGEGCTNQDPPDVERFEDVEEMLSGDSCVCYEAGGPIIHIPRWIQQREVASHTQPKDEIQ